MLSIFHVPVLSSVVTSPYGNRIDPIDKVEKFHHGIDFGGKEGDVVLAARDGVIKEVGENPVRGKYIIIRHEDLTEAHYWHLSKQLITKTGLFIRARQAIGLMGRTGRTTGPHLHFEVRDRNGNSIDPGQLLSVVLPAEGAKVSNVAFESMLLLFALGAAFFFFRGRNGV